MPDERQDEAPLPSIANSPQNPTLLWARRAALGYLGAALFVLTLTWNGDYELGPRWNFVAWLSWPVSNLVLQAFGVAYKVFGVTSNLDDLKIPAIAVIVLTGTAYWAMLGYWEEKINRWRKTC